MTEAKFINSYIETIKDKTTAATAAIKGLQGAVKQEGADILASSITFPERSPSTLDPHAYDSLSA